LSIVQLSRFLLRFVHLRQLVYFITSISLCQELFEVFIFVAATILAVRPLLVSEPGQYEGLGLFCLRMWLTFNIPTIVFMFPYFSQRRRLKASRLQQEQMRNSPEEASSGAAH